MTAQFIHGTQYIDEVVMIRAKDKGDLYVHQDANWNVVGLTDLGGRLVERYVYSPYGELIVHQATGYGDRDGDGTVDSTDKGTPGSTCTTMSGSCRILDLDFDGDYDSSDATLFDALPSGLQRNPGKLASGVSQPFAHQGLLFEPEIGSYQNRARQYDPAERRFIQRDPIRSGLATYSEVSDLNDYYYVNASPNNHTDPSGLISVSNFSSRNCGRVKCFCPSGIGPSSVSVGVWRGAGGNGGLYNQFTNKIAIDATSCCAMLSSTFLIDGWATLDMVMRHECVHACQRYRDGLAKYTYDSWYWYQQCGGRHVIVNGQECHPHEREAVEQAGNTSWTWTRKPSNCDPTR